MGQHLPDTKEESDVRTDHDVIEPSMYQVLLHNDDYTTMEFVVHVLMQVFRKSVEEATRIMLNVHERGVGVCGTYPYEVAETKVETVIRLARENGHPLQCTMEKV
jgi:ATP-dependent Clp protease adaptor protein ClpS